MSKISLRLTIFGASIAVIAGLVASMAGAAAAATCTATGMVRDEINLTAAVMNPTAPVTGEVDRPAATSASTALRPTSPARSAAPTSMAPTTTASS